MSFSIIEISVFVGLCIVPVVMGIVLVVAAIWHKTGTSDVLSWPSSGQSEDGEEGDPYEEYDEDNGTEQFEEASEFEDLEHGDEELTRPASGHRPMSPPTTPSPTCRP